MQRFTSLTILLCTMFLSSCGTYLEQKATEPALNQTEKEKLSLGFASVKEIVFSERCVSCHQQYDTYQGVIRELSAIKAAVESNRMPRSGGSLTDSQKAILSAWIEKGAPEQVGNSGEPIAPVKLEPTWKSLSENVIFPKCLVCHNPQGQAKFLDLSSRQIIFDNRYRVFGADSIFIDLDSPEESYLLQILNDDEEPMPPVWSNIPRLTQNELKTLTKWLSLGLP
jgi:uncharacterized membrane protein